MLYIYGLVSISTLIHAYEWFTKLVYSVYVSAKHNLRLKEEIITKLQLNTSQKITISTSSYFLLLCLLFHVTIYIYNMKYAIYES